MPANISPVSLFLKVFTDVKIAIHTVRVLNAKSYIENVTQANICKYHQVNSL